MSNDSNNRTSDIDIALKSMDKKIADNVSTLRVSQGLSRKQLAEAIGVAQAQMNKYEKAENRISASRLELIAKALSSDVSYFYNGINPEGGDYKLTKRQHRSLILARNFLKIKSEKTQIAISHLVASLVENQE